MYVYTQRYQKMIWFYCHVYEYAQRYPTSGTLYCHAYLHAQRYNCTCVRNIVIYMKIPDGNIILSACIWL